jgi:hypothetical protein
MQFLRKLVPAIIRGYFPCPSLFMAKLPAI